jgi:hypothetical protein
VTSVGAAGATTERIYVSVWNTETGSSRLVIYDDQGQTSREQVLRPAADRPFVHLVGVVAPADPGPPETPPVLLFVATDVINGIDLELYASSDEGQTLEPLGTTTGPALDVLSIDPEHWLLATGRPLVDITGGGASIASVGDLNIYCLLPYSGAILACTAFLRVNYAIARSDDDGATFTPFMTYQQLEAPRCAAGTPAADVCGPLFPALQEQLQPRDFDGGPFPDLGPPPDLPAGDAAADGSAADAVPVDTAGDRAGADSACPAGDCGGKGSGCSLVAAPVAAGHHGGMLALLLLAIGLVLRRRRARS